MHDASIMIVSLVCLRRGRGQMREPWFATRTHHVGYQCRFHADIKSTVSVNQNQTLQTGLQAHVPRNGATVDMCIYVGNIK